MSLPVSVYEPLWIGTRPLGDYTVASEDYSHVKKAFGGYWSAKFEVEAGVALAEEWLISGLGRHVVVSNPALDVIWEGFVDRVNVTIGAVRIGIGPLLQVANRVTAVYTPSDPDAVPAVTGTTTPLAAIDDADSQALYGILPKTINVGPVSAAEATVIQNSYLKRAKRPRTSQDWGSTKSVSIDVQAECKGYVHWLNWTYEDETEGTQDADVKIKAVLADTPNSAWLSFDTAHVDVNTLQVPQQEMSNRDAMTVIEDVVSRGDASYNRWLFGIYAGREARYEQAPDNVEYYQRLADPALAVVTTGQGDVDPWDVEAGKWLILSDLLVGEREPASLEEDLRAIFIESADYKDPWGLTIKGGMVDEVSQVLAQYGLSGMR